MFFGSLPLNFALTIAHRPPNAVAEVRGGRQNPNLRGRVSFWQTPSGVLVSADVSGLPTGRVPCAQSILALHIHEGRGCGGNRTNEFAAAGGHFNPRNCPHPFHAGDLPPLFVTRNGTAWMTVLTDRFSVREIIGRTVIIHGGADDFRTQPSGNSGPMVACGVITQR